MQFFGTLLTVAAYLYASKVIPEKPGTAKNHSRKNMALQECCFCFVKKG